MSSLIEEKRKFEQEKFLNCNNFEYYIYLSYIIIALVFSLP